MPGRRCPRQPPLPTTDLASTGWTPLHPPVEPPADPPAALPRSSSASPGSPGARSPPGSSTTGGGCWASPAAHASDLPGVEPLQADLTDAERPGGGARPPRPDARLRHRVGPPGDRGREHPGERRHGPRPARRGSSRRDGASRRAADRAQALPRAVRGLRPGRRAGHPVPRGRGAPRPPELLLRPGGRAPRRRRARRLHLERPPGAHDHRLRRRQRDEHGPDARRAGRDLPRAGRAVRLPRLARRSGTASPT